MSEIRVTTISDTAGTGPVTLTKQSAAKIWVQFNGTGTIAINGSHAVSGLVDHGTGDYTVNYSNNTSNTNYCHQGTSHFGGVTTGIYTFGLGDNVTFSTTRLVSSIRYESTFASSSANRSNFDATELTLSIHGDLA